MSRSSDATIRRHDHGTNKVNKNSAEKLESGLFPSLALLANGDGLTAHERSAGQ